MMLSAQGLHRHTAGRKRGEGNGREDTGRRGRREAGASGTEFLDGEGYETTWIASGEEALRVDAGQFGLIILDLMLPGAHGLDVLRRLRDTCDVPVLILSARNETTDKVRAFGLGADDYVPKPFWPEELLARVRARLRRPLMQHANGISVGDLAVDPVARRVTVSGVPVELTRAEFDLLAALARRPGAAITRAWLVEHVPRPRA